MVKGDEDRRTDKGAAENVAEWLEEHRRLERAKWKDRVENLDFLKDEEVYLELENFGDDEEQVFWGMCYDFKAFTHDGEEIGHCDIRVRHNENTYLGGNIGYEVYPAYRGKGYALRFAKLLIELAKKHELEFIYVTCHPDNAPSRKTCERLGADFVEEVDVPPFTYMYLTGERRKRVYRLDLV